MEKSLDSQLVLCDKEAAVEYILKLFDTRTIDGPQIRITWHDLEKVHLLPLSMECTSDSLRHWLRHRTIPANRAYVQNFLSKLGLSEKDFMGILDVGRSRNTVVQNTVQILQLLCLMQHTVHLVGQGAEAFTRGFLIIKCLFVI